MVSVTHLTESSGVRSFYDEPGHHINLSNDFVLLRLPSASEMRSLYKGFNRLVRDLLHELFTTPYGVLAARCGKLGFGETADRESLPYGLMSSGSPALFANLRKSEAVATFVRLGKHTTVTTRGKVRTKMRDGDGSVEDKVLALDDKERAAFLRSIVFDSTSLDDFLKFQQLAKAGDRELSDVVVKGRDGFEILHAVATETERSLYQSERPHPSSKATGSQQKFAFVWFAEFLAREGVWLWPVSYVNRSRYLAPGRLMPLSVYLPLPPSEREFADLVLSFQKDQRATAAAVVLNVFLILSLASTAWKQTRLPHRSLLAFKEWAQHAPSGNFLSSSTNALYRLLTNHRGIDPTGRSEAAHFHMQKRLANRGVEPFAWVFDPRPRNTRTVQRCLGSPITEVPEHVKSWALQFRSLLPAYKVKQIGTVVDCLDTWLIYLMTLSPAEAPASLRDIDRTRHVNDMRDADSRTYHRFLKVHFTEDAREIGQQAITKMKQAWQFAAIQEGFSKASNPFDVELDRAVGLRKRNHRTVRKPMEMAVWELIVEENRKDDYRFARELGRERYWLRLRVPGTAEFESVFWPAEAIVVDVILNSAARHKMARWLDSGEGDEFLVDVEQAVEVRNTLPVAQPKRRAGFLRLIDLVGKERRRVVGMFFNTNKTGAPFEVPWIDHGLARSIVRMRDLQIRYNPIDRPIPARDPDVSDGYVDLTNFAEVFPLFRNPGHPGAVAVSSTRVLAYWKALLEHCQPLVNEALGDHYPLIADDEAVFDHHALRVTVVTNLLEAGVDVSIVQSLVGHATMVMTWYYNAKRNEQVHRTIQEAFEARKLALDRLRVGDPDAVSEVIAQAAVPDFVEDHVGVDLLREHGTMRTAPIDIFSHGLCPGGNCETGGERYLDGKHHPVWRPRACSGCRYRVTGPMFLNGLVNRLNMLTAEMRHSRRRAIEFSEQIDEIEKTTGKPAYALRGSRDREKEFRDKLAKEWALELKTIKLCQHLMETAAGNGGSAMNMLVPTGDIDPASLSLDFGEVHELELFHNLVKETTIIPASIIEMPSGTEEQWERALREILRHNGMADLVVRLPPKQAKEAYLRFGDALLAEVGEPSRLQEMIDGFLLFDDVPSLAAARPVIEEAFAIVVEVARGVLDDE
jgi:hypothetical protein